MWVSGSYPKPGQFVAVPVTMAPRVPLASPSTPGAHGDSTTLYGLRRSTAFCRSSGVKSIRSSGTLLRKLRAYRNPSGGNGCVGDVFSPGTSDCGTGLSSIGHTGCPVTRSNTYSHPSLLGDATALIGLPFTLMSSSSAADELSKFQIGWCTNWKCHLRWP